MVMIGVDPHKATHTAVAVDDSTASIVEEITVPARDRGHAALLAWADRFAERTWALEDCRHVSGRLERALVAASERVLRVPPKLMGQVRREARTYGKSDAIDAVAVARAGLREPDLPEASHTAQAHAASQLRLLVDRREDLVEERTREINRLRWHLHDLAPELNPPARKLCYRPGWERVANWLDDQPPTTRVVVARDLCDRIDRLTVQSNRYAATIRAQVRDHHPELLAIPGCGALNAAKLVGEIGDIHRFPTDGHLAMHVGTAPLPVSTARSNRVRLNRRGNRQLNAAIHRIAITQCRHHQPARDYIARHTARGHTKREAIRALKRHITRRIYTTMKNASPTPSQVPSLT